MRGGATPSRPTSCYSRGVVNRLDDVYAQLSLTKVWEGCLEECKPCRKPIRGYSSGSGHITINPIPDILDTLIHELLHERYPGWSERTVKRETTKLIRKLSTDDMSALHQEYEKCRSKLKKKKTVE